MSAAAALDYTYRYPFASAVGATDQGFGLALATSGLHQDNPHFFEGRLLQPRAVGDMLLVLSNVVRTHFYLPQLPMLDPVVTSSESMLRFEGFSGCCGVYARVDLPPESFDGALKGRGTTNVDFNDPMRAALTRLRDHDEARLAVGRDEVLLEREGHAVVERKVKLPVRWIKGFSEVQAYQPRLTPVLEVPAAEARRFIRGLPRGGAPKRPSYVVQTGRALRLSQRATRGAIRVTGTERIRVLEPLLGAARTLRLWADADAGTSAWEILYDTGRFFLMISPELYRGFSGEGQVLKQLGTAGWEDALPHVRAQLTWQNRIDPAALAARVDFDVDTVNAALAALGARGLAGYDVTTGQYFHRELPFDLDQVEALQPRLKGARKLLDQNGVRLRETLGDDAWELDVDGTDVTHCVRLTPDIDKCTCPWFNKHRGERGPCKHILASRMMIAAPEEGTEEAIDDAEGARSA